jgi:cytochrome c
MKLHGLRIANCRDADAAQSGRRRVAHVIFSRGLISELRIAAIIFGLSISTASAQDVAAGEISFSRCLGCHSIGVDAKNKIGPQLNGIEGRKCGTVDGYGYSAANKACAFTWSEAVFSEYIKNPKAKIPGTKKSISGIKDETEARNLWAFLRQFGVDGQPNRPKQAN